MLRLFYKYKQRRPRFKSTQVPAEGPAVNTDSGYAQRNLLELLHLLKFTVYLSTLYHIYSCI